MIIIDELRDGVSKFGGGYLTDSGWAALIDRLEAAEKAVNEAYQRGYKTGQEEVEKERDALRAKIAEMERQEPIFWWRPRSDGAYEGPIHNSIIEQVRKQSSAWYPLYALPGAKGD